MAGELHYLLNFLQVFDLPEVVHDDADLITVVDTQLDASVEDTIVAADGNLVDVDTELFGEDIRDVTQQTLAVDTTNLDYGIEEQLLVHTPFCIDKPVAEACLKLGSHRTGTLVNLDVPFIVDISENVIARDRVATVWENKFAYGILAYDDSLLLVELVVNDKLFDLLFLFFLCLLIFTDERH